MVLPSGSHCRSLFAPPSLVNCFRPDPSTFISQISLLATKAILSAPPRMDDDGAVVSSGASVGAAGVSVLVAARFATGTAVELFGEAGASVFAEREVEVLTGTPVFAGLSPPLITNKAPAITTSAPN